MGRKRFCCLCRGPADDGPLQNCSTCPDVFHIECISRKIVTNGKDNNFVCDTCQSEEIYKSENGGKSSNEKDVEKLALMKRNREWYKTLLYEKREFLKENRVAFEVFCTSDKVDKQLKFNKNIHGTVEGREVTEKEYKSVVELKKTPPYMINVHLRDYQLEGVAALSSW